MNKGRVRPILEELLLYSGQFGLFYILMQLIIEKAAFFTNAGHLGLLISLGIQATLLSLYGNRRPLRLLFSFIVPVVYSALELSEGRIFLLNAAHIGFWIYAILSALFMIARGSGTERLSRVTETLLVVINILLFLFLYFYFDTWKDIKNNEFLTILVIFRYLPTFLLDPTHWYIIIGGGLLAVTISLGRFEVAKLKDRIYALFGKYVDQNVRDKIVNEGQIVAKKQNLCILFSDIVDFTQLCETYDASSIARMLSIYFEYWNSKVKKHNGTIDKYIGDAIMVIFGLDNGKNACDLAVMCAIEMQNEQNNFFEELRARGLPVPKGYGVGCHFGELIVGDIGSEDRKNFTVIGDTVNIASRLESATRKVNSKIVISNKVYIALDTELKQLFGSIGQIELKGRSEPLPAWGIMDVTPAGES